MPTILSHLFTRRDEHTTSLIPQIPGSFTVECTLPPQTTNFITAPNARGTLEILESGFLCVLVCIWTVQHLNVPQQRDGRSRGLSGKWYWQLKLLRTRLKWMLVTLILPEFLVGKALSDFMGARESMKRVRELRDVEGKPLADEEVEGWTKVHAFYGDMGGFVLRTNRPRSNGEGFALQHLVSEEVLRLREQGTITRLPSIHKDRIVAMSKGDVFVKLLAVFEITWMVIEVSFRKAYDLPISQLEITACAFCSTTLVTYALWWTKPQGVKIATIIPLAPSASTELLFEPRLPGFWRYRLAHFDSDALRQRDRPDEPVSMERLRARTSSARSSSTPITQHGDARHWHHNRQHPARMRASHSLELPVPVTHRATALAVLLHRHHLGDPIILPGLQHHRGD
ncbi:hypothetical protein BP5796_11812 [Coleophoma crateriformis]|uniref:Uncharacterized protein n=1 Tax=Coleophoma crateriformis TaxID=565419 RepID=A0A3D8QED6_9HELO|nr:hypothetical protein BP5796_11812 [Coleophoma crateriformis]